MTVSTLLVRLNLINNYFWIILNNKLIYILIYILNNKLIIN